MNYHMTLAGLSRYPNKGEYLKPVLDGHPILGLNYSDFSALMANIKSFTQVKWQKLTTHDLIGPVKAFHQVTGAGNMAIAAQVPKCLSSESKENADVDQDYLFVFFISGVEQNCELVGESYSKDLAQRWIHKVKDRADQTVPLTATESCMLKILGEQEVNNADFIKGLE